MGFVKFAKNRRKTTKKDIVHLGRKRLLEILTGTGFGCFDRENLADIIDALDIYGLMWLRDTMVAVVRETKQNNRN